MAVNDAPGGTVGGAREVEDFVPGTIAAVRRQRGAGQVEIGAVSASAYPSVTVALDGPSSVVAGDPVSLFFGGIEGPTIASAMCLQISGNVAVLRLTDRPRSRAPRKDLRFATDFTVRVGAGTASELPGRLVDLSLGGAAALVPSPPEGQELDLRVALDDFATALPCEVVDVRYFAGVYLAHLRFRPLDFAQGALVQQIVSEAKSRLTIEAAA